MKGIGEGGRIIKDQHKHFDDPPTGKRFSEQGYVSGHSDLSIGFQNKNCILKGHQQQMMLTN